jgi:hypothetical protein
MERKVKVIEVKRVVEGLAKDTKIVKSPHHYLNHEFVEILLLEPQRVIRKKTFST